MKRKLTVNTLAFASLKKRKKRYAIMLAGIVLAMVFSSSIVLFVFSAYETQLAENYDRYGYQDSIIYTYENSERVYKQAVEDGVLADYGLAHIIGYSYASEDDRDYGASIAWLDDRAKALSNQSLIEGAYPEKDGEIAIEQSALTRLGINAEVGDEITLSVRVQDNNKYKDTAAKTYTLVGILSNKYNYLAQYAMADYTDTIPTAFVAAGSQVDAGGLEKLVAYITYGPNYDWQEFYKYITAYEDKIDECGMDAQSNTGFSESISEIGSGGSTWAMIVVLVLAFSSCMAIVNSFNSNLKERKKQIGMLRAVGATRRQVINIFGREALVICLVCTPISLGVSWAAVRLLLGLVSDRPVMEHSLRVLALAAVICVAVTMLAALVPLLSAARISPMQAIRDIDINRKMKVKKIKSKKQFNMQRHLAKRSVTFYRGAKIAVSAILATVILFTCYGFSYFSAAKSDYDAAVWESDYFIDGMAGAYSSDAVNYGLSGMSEGELSEINTCPYLSGVLASKKIGAHLHMDEITDYYKSICELGNWYDDPLFSGNDSATYENHAEEAFNRLSENYTESKNLYGYTDEYAACELWAHSGEAVKSLGSVLTDGEINLSALAAGTEVVLVAPQTAALQIKLDNEGRVDLYGSAYDGEAISDGFQAVLNGESPYRVGDKITMSIIVYDSAEAADENPESYTRIDREATIGAIVSPRAAQKISNYDYFLPDFGLLTTNSGMDALCSGVKYANAAMYVDDSIEMTDDTDSAIMAVLAPIIQKYGVTCNSNYAFNKEVEQEMKTLFIAMLALIIIGITIAGSIINNALTASIREGKREIGTLRAVGAAGREIVLSYAHRLCSMFGLGCAVGFGGFTVSFIAADFIITRVRKGAFEFTFSPWAAIAFTLALFALCAFNLRSKIKQEMKNSIVENIREL